MKKKLGQIIPSYPMPVALVGTMVNGKPNFLTAAWFSMVSYQPPLLAVVLGRNHFTNRGIRETGVFSVCIPGEDMVEVTDFAGIYSGEKVDKSELFEVFYGETGAPLIQECPFSIECKVEKTEINGLNEMFIGRIAQVYADDAVLTSDTIDLEKVRPLILSQGDTRYYKLGAKYEKAWGVGKNYHK